MRVVGCVLLLPGQGEGPPVPYPRAPYSHGKCCCIHACCVLRPIRAAVRLLVPPPATASRVASCLSLRPPGHPAGVFSPQDAVDFAQREMALKGRDPKQTCNRLLHEAIRERRCKDNCTVMLVKIG